MTSTNSLVVPLHQQYYLFQHDGAALDAATNNYSHCTWSKLSKIMSVEAFVPVMKPNESRLTGSLGFQRGGTMKERQNKSGALSPDRSHREIRTPSHASVLLLCTIIARVSIPGSLYSLCNQLIMARSSRPGHLHYLLSCIVLQQHMFFCPCALKKIFFDTNWGTNCSLISLKRKF